MMACVRLAIQLSRAQRKQDGPMLSRTLHGICAAALDNSGNTRQDVQSVTALVAQMGCDTPAPENRQHQAEHQISTRCTTTDRVEGNTNLRGKTVSKMTMMTLNSRM